MHASSSLAHTLLRAGWASGKVAAEPLGFWVCRRCLSSLGGSAQGGDGSQDFGAPGGHPPAKTRQLKGEVAEGAAQNDGQWSSPQTHTAMAPGDHARSANPLPRVKPHTFGLSKRAPGQEINKNGYVFDMGYDLISC